MSMSKFYNNVGETVLSINDLFKVKKYKFKEISFSDDDDNDDDLNHADKNMSDPKEKKNDILQNDAFQWKQSINVSQSNKADLKPLDQLEVYQKFIENIDNKTNINRKQQTKKSVNTTTTIQLPSIYLPNQNNLTRNYDDYMARYLSHIQTQQAYQKVKLMNIESDENDNNIENNEINTLVCCDRCGSWRVLSRHYNLDLIYDKWYCEMNPDIGHASCHAIIEPYEDDQLHQNFCHICYQGELNVKDGVLIKCAGECLRSFHSKCVNLEPYKPKNDDEKFDPFNTMVWYCNECISRRWHCFRCNDRHKNLYKAWTCPILDCQKNIIKIIIVIDVKPY